MSSTTILAFAGAFVAVSMATVFAWHARRSVAHWSFAAGMLLLAVEAVFFGLSADAALPEEMAYWQNFRMLAMSFLPVVWLFFSLTYARGGSREFLIRWRGRLTLAFILPVAIAISFQRQLVVAIGQTETQGQWVFALGLPGVALSLIFLLSAVMIVMNLERTYRAAIGTMRWRIKFMILGLGVLFVVRAYTSTQNLLFHSITLPLQTLNACALLVACFLIIRSLLRSGHFEVSVYPSQSVLRNSITVFLAGIYLLIVGLLAKLASFLGWNSAASFTQKAFALLVGLVLLSVMLMSDRFRLQTKRLVSRHFQRPLHDYRAVWRSFTEATALRMDQTELCRAVARLVADHFHALSVTIWVLDDKKQNLTFAASTFLSESKGAELTPRAKDAADIVKAVRIHPEPVEIESLNDNWAQALKRCHPDEFPNGGNRVCAPMVSGGEVIGVMTLGDRVGGLVFLQQDFDLLKCLGDQMAANLRNLQLSCKLLEVKELEAFQSMSAFFVHDLKNTASTLSLMLQNLPVHFNDPAFREDALRGISRTVTHINQLITRLGLLRQGLKINPAEGDLSEAVAKILSGLPATQGVEYVKNLEPMPKLFFDQEQVGKVVTNLVINATEAVGKGGQIRIGTSRINGWAILTVADNGCGMSYEFLSGSLFRPFQTTKKNGLGIGMFQSKMIIEAHGGRIDVESEAGKGTSFRVFLPLGNGIS